MYIPLDDVGKGSSDIQHHMSNLNHNEAIQLLLNVQGTKQNFQKLG